MGLNALCTAAALLLLLPLVACHAAAIACPGGLCCLVLLRCQAGAGVPMGRPSKSTLPVGAHLLPPRLPLLLLLLLLADPSATRITAGQAVGTVTTLAGTSGVTGSANGLGTVASFSFLTGVAMDAAGTVALVVSDTGGIQGIGVTPPA